MHAIKNELASMKATQELIRLEANSPEVGLEAISAINLKKHLTTLVGNLRDLKKLTISIVTFADKPMKSNAFALKAGVRNAKFQAISKFTVFKPMGFKGYMLDLVTDLDINVAKLKGISDGIDMTSIAVAGYISDPESLSKLNTSDSEVCGFNPTEASEAIGLFFQGAEGVDRDKLIELYKRLKDFDHAGDLLIAVNNTINKDEVYKTLKERADKLYEIIEHLESTFTENVTVSKSTALYLSAVIYNLADGLAYYSLYRAKLQATTTAVADSVIALNKLVN